MSSFAVLALFLTTTFGQAQDVPATLRVVVTHEGTAVAGASVAVGTAKYTSDAAGKVTASLPAGMVEILVTKAGFADLKSTLMLRAGETQDVTFELQEEFEETVTVSATRTETRLEDQPMRVEVVPGEEVQEKIMMTPGDISMLLNETNGLRVQTTSPSLGGANVRIQGLRGKYTQVVADGLPLYGGQTGSIGILQIPPMDLGQVEVIKGVASALYGMSAIGGVVNLISRRPPESGRERELLVNGTSHGGTDVISWLAAPINDTWGYTFLGGVHTARRSDLDADGWTDLPAYERVVARPRFFWNDGSGRSLMVAVGAMGERRRGGTRPGRFAPDDTAFSENLNTKRFDAGAVWRMATASGNVIAVRGSATAERRTHVFGDVVEDDGHQTSFGEVSLMRPAARQTWVIGAAAEAHRYRSQQVPRFNYTYVVPGAFVQDELRLTRALTLSGSARLDVHNEFGTFLSPQASALIRPADAWTVRVSAGRGYFAPTPFTDETDVTGLSKLAALGPLKTERATNVMTDVTWKRRPFDITATVFASRIEGALDIRETGRADYPVEIVNLDGTSRTRGTELIAHYRREGDIDVIATHMFLLSSEPHEGGRRDVALNPRHSATFDVLKQIGPARIGFEVFYTGRQVLDDNPYRVTGSTQVLFGGLVDWAIGRSRIYVNIENLGDVRQTRKDPLVKPQRGADGRWTVDAWAPLEGRTLNAGVRWRF
jgi:outer membrane receptor for ferrienterochelin and colicins